MIKHQEWTFNETGIFPNIWFNTMTILGKWTLHEMRLPFPYQREITLVKRISLEVGKNANGLLLFNFCFTRYFIYSAPVDANCTKSMKFTWIFIRKVIPIHYLFACLYWKYIISCYRIKAYYLEIRELANFSFVVYFWNITTCRL